MVAECRRMLPQASRLKRVVKMQVATTMPECSGGMFRTYLQPLKVVEERTEVMQRLLAAFLALPDGVVSGLQQHCILHSAAVMAIFTGTAS